MTVIAFVFARGGSKGLPHKNLRTIGGIPLLGHAIGHAQAATLVDRVIVSTEDAEIAETARAYGAEVLDRPAELATDDAPEWACWQHAVRATGMGPGDVFVSVPCTAPLRLPGDVDAVIRALPEDQWDAVITVTPSHRNPYFNQVVRMADASVRPVIEVCGSTPIRRQDTPTVFDVTTVAYAARPTFVLSALSLWEGAVREVIVPPERALDIDTELDLRIAEFLWGERGNNG